MYSIVTNLGGEIRVESELDKGSRFLVDLPRSSEPLANEAVRDSF